MSDFFQSSIKWGTYVVNYAAETWNTHNKERVFSNSHSLNPSRNVETEKREVIVSKKAQQIVTISNYKNGFSTGVYEKSQKDLHKALDDLEQKELEVLKIRESIKKTVEALTLKKTNKEHFTFQIKHEFNEIITKGEKLESQDLKQTAKNIEKGSKTLDVFDSEIHELDKSLALLKINEESALNAYEEALSKAKDAQNEMKKLFTEIKTELNQSTQKIKEINKKIPDVVFGANT